MKRYKFKLLSVFIFPLMLVLATVNVGYSQSTTMSVDPSAIVDDGLQAPSTFEVSINLLDAANVFSWQYNMSWDPSILQVTEVVWGDFLQGNPNETLEAVADYHASSTTYTSLTNPWGSHDGYLGTYASLQYSEKDGEFWLHTFPQDDYSAGSSQILQVDLTVKYEATASAASDKYRIYWDLFGIPAVLVDWTSAAAPLGTHVWTNIPCPFGPPWYWGYIPPIKIVVGTDRVGGDATAVLDLYEAWLTVTYLRPTSAYDDIDNVAGWASVQEATFGTYITGISGSGWLANMTFEVLSYGYTELNIDDPLTVLYDPLYHSIPFAPQNGYFRNLYPGDVDGDKYVGSADAGVLNGAYGTWRGDPLYVREADFDDDGYIGSADAGILNYHYGETYP